MHFDAMQNRSGMFETGVVAVASMRCKLRVSPH
jgi:hypothetical protein